MFTQVITLCLASLAAASVIPYGAPVAAVYDAPPQPYTTGFDVVDEYGTRLSRQEQGDAAGNKVGSYAYVDANGISRQVDYVADAAGFRAVIRTNEPGTESQNPADVELISSAVPAAHSGPAVAAYAQPAAYRPALAPAPLRRAVPYATAVSGTPGAYSAVGPASALSVTPSGYSAVGPALALRPAVAHPRARVY